LKSEPQNIESAGGNDEVWNRLGLRSSSYDPTSRSDYFSNILIDRIPYFDIHYSLFDIRYVLLEVSYPIRPAVL